MLLVPSGLRPHRTSSFESANPTLVSSWQTWGASESSILSATWRCGFFRTSWPICLQRAISGGGTVCCAYATTGAHTYFRALLKGKALGRCGRHLRLFNLTRSARYLWLAILLFCPVLCPTGHPTLQGRHTTNVSHLCETLLFGLVRLEGPCPYSW